jgi:hypothetical protein
MARHLPGLAHVDLKQAVEAYSRAYEGNSRLARTLSFYREFRMAAPANAEAEVMVGCLVEAVARHHTAVLVEGFPATRHHLECLGGLQSELAGRLGLTVLQLPLQVLARRVADARILKRTGTLETPALRAGTAAVLDDDDSSALETMLTSEQEGVGDIRWEDGPPDSISRARASLSKYRDWSLTAGEIEHITAALVCKLHQIEVQPSEKRAKRQLRISTGVWADTRAFVWDKEVSSAGLAPSRIPSCERFTMNILQLAVSLPVRGLFAPSSESLNSLHSRRRLTHLPLRISFPQRHPSHTCGWVHIRADGSGSVAQIARKGNNPTVWQTLAQKLPTSRSAVDAAKRQFWFKQMDVKGNGRLSLEEVGLGLKLMLQCEQLFSIKPVILRAYTAARNVSGKQCGRKSEYVDLTEFRALLSYLRQHFEWWEMFARIDSNSDRRLDFAEFQRCAKEVQAWGVDIRDPEAVFKCLDLDGNGLIYFDDFCNWAISIDLDLESDDDTKPAGALKGTGSFGLGSERGLGRERRNVASNCESRLMSFFPLFLLGSSEQLVRGVVERLSALGFASVDVSQLLHTRYPSPSPFPTPALLCADILAEVRQRVRPFDVQALPKPHVVFSGFPDDQLMWGAWVDAAISSPVFALHVRLSDSSSSGDSNVSLREMVPTSLDACPGRHAEVHVRRLVGQDPAELYHLVYISTLEHVLALHSWRKDMAEGSNDGRDDADLKDDGRVLYNATGEFPASVINPVLPERQQADFDRVPRWLHVDQVLVIVEQLVLATTAAICSELTALYARHENKQLPVPDGQSGSAAQPVGSATAKATELRVTVAEQQVWYWFEIIITFL